MHSILPRLIFSTELCLRLGLLLLALVASAEAFAQAVVRSAPPHRGEGVPAHPVLSWAYSGPQGDLNLLPNGGFEEGTNGWSATPEMIASQVQQAAPFEGTNLLSLPRNSLLTRELVLPAEVALRLSYMALVSRDPLVELERLDHPGRKYPLTGPSTFISGWRIYGADLSPFAGERVRLSWKFITDDNVSWGLDDVRITPVPVGTEFDVWLSTGSQNGPFELLGRTTRSAWPLRNLLPSRRYYWRVDTIEAGQTNAGPVWQFNTDFVTSMSQVLVDPLPELACSEQPLLLGLQVTDDDGFPGPSNNNTRVVRAAVEAFGEGVPPPPVIVTELDLSRAWVEFQNSGAEPVDLSGWMVELLPSSITPNTFRVPVPTGSILAAGGLFQVRQGPGSGWPTLGTNAPFGWSSGVAAGVILRDSHGEVVDCAFYSRDMPVPRDGRRFGQTVAVSPAHWPSLPFWAPDRAGKSMQRVGDRDRNSPQDWVFAPPSPMAINADLTLPLLNGHGRVATTAPTNEITTDRQSHFLLPVQVMGTASNVVLTATVFLNRADRTGVSGQSLSFDVGPGVCLSVELPVINETAGTLTGAVRVRIPAPREADVPVRLELPGGTSEGVTLPELIVIPAGATEAAGDLTLVNNSELTGPRSLTLFASAPDFAPAQIPLVIEDDETATLRLEIPLALGEGEQRPGTITVNPAPSRAVRIRLISSDPARLGLSSSPATSDEVVVQAGATMATFSLTTTENDRLEGSTNITVRAEFANWGADEKVVQIDENETRTLSLNLDAAELWEGGSPTDLRVVLGGRVPEEVPVTLTLEPQGRVEMIGSPTVPANSRLSTVSLVPINDSQTNGLSQILIRASAPGWADGTLTLTVYDDDPAGIRVGLPPGPMVSGQAFECLVSPISIDGLVIPYRGLPDLQLALLGPDSVALPGHIQFLETSEGGSRFSISSASAGTGLRLRAGWEGLTGESAAFALWSAGPPLNPISLAHDEVRNRLFMVSSDQPLVAVNLNTGARSEPDIPLPHPRLVALSADGETVYAGWQAGRQLARIRASTLAVEETWPVGASFTGSGFTLVHMLTLPLHPNSLVVARTLAGSLEVAMFDGSTARLAVGTMDAPPPVTLVAGLQPDQIFAVSTDRIAEFRITPEGIQSVTQPRRLGLLDRKMIPGDSTFSRGLLLNGAVELIDPALAGRAGRNPFDLLPSAVTSDPRTGRLAWYEGGFDGLFRILDPLTLKEVWRSKRSGQPDMGLMIPLGPHRWAVINNGALRLDSDEAPEPDPATDLAISATEVSRSAATSRVTMRLTVENRGTNPAADVRLTLAFPEVRWNGPDSILLTSISSNALPVTNGLGGASYQLGDLAPTAKAEVDVEVRVSLNGVLDASAFVGSDAADPDPGNNRAFLHAEGLAPQPTLKLAGPVGTSAYSVQYETIPGWFYQLVTAPTPEGPWQGVGGATGDGQPATLPLPAPEWPVHFWRVELSDL